MGCWLWLWNCLTPAPASEELQRSRRPAVMLDRLRKGPDAVVLMSGRRVCGTGGIVGNAPLLQDKSYFEVKLQAVGAWGVGVATRAEKLSELPLGESAHSWVLRNDGSTFHNDQEIRRTGVKFEEGDVLGCTYDHSQLCFYVNGRPLDAPLAGARGEVFPVFYVDDGAILDVAFSEFSQAVPQGFEAIMFEQSIL